MFAVHESAGRKINEHESCVNMLRAAVRKQYPFTTLLCASSTNSEDSGYWRDIGVSGLLTNDSYLE